MSSIYDPLGLVSPFILKAKLLFQDLCCMQVGWDEHIPESIEKQWYHWLDDLQSIDKRTKVPRCIKPLHFHGTTAQIHHFADAS